MTLNNQIITIDGPAGSGKGTVAHAIAKKLNFHLLDSGAIYRLAALAIDQKKIDLNNRHELLSHITSASMEFIPNNDGSVTALLNGKKVDEAIRTEACAANSSKIAALPEVRAALLIRQHHFNQPPGLVADGRDMGTVVFPEAQCKFFLTASATTRALRRQKQLKQKGTDVRLKGLIKDIEERDRRDRERAIAPLKPALDAHIIDTDNIPVTEVIKQTMALIKLKILNNID